MANEFFIARKIFLKQNEGRKVARPIVRISMFTIALALIVNLLTVAVVIGFQKEVRQKISGFSAHATILNAKSQSILEGDAIRIDQEFLNQVSKNEAILSIKPVGYKPVLFQSDKIQRDIQLADGSDTTTYEQNIDGALLKGVQADYDWEFLKKHLVEGKLPNFDLSEDALPEILTSTTLAKRLSYELGDTVPAYFVKERAALRKFVIAGLYNTGLEEFDRKTVYADLKLVQELNDWGLQARLEILDTLSDGYMVIKAEIDGGSGYYEYDWGKGFRQTIGVKICPTRDTTFQVIVRERAEFLASNGLAKSKPDTATLRIKISGDRYSACDFKTDVFGDLEKTYFEDENHFVLEASNKKLEIQSTSGNGSKKDYIGGFELRFKEWDKLDEEVKDLRMSIGFLPTEHNEQLRIQSIKDEQEDIFIWLDFLDLNVYIILALMLLIGIVNVGAALLVLILVLTPTIGMLKAMGSTNWQIRKIFLLQALLLIGKGLFWGNVFGIGIAVLQSYTGFLSLNPEVYYLSEVPIDLPIWVIVAMNIGTILVCLLALLLPSSIIARISPSKSIRFA